jgi:hypothetical protein
MSPARKPAKRSRRPSKASVWTWGLLLGALTGSSACAADGEKAPTSSSVAVQAEGSASGRPIARNMPALRAVESALEDGDDQIARRILQQVRLRSPTDRELEIVAVFERILTGRELVRELEVELVSTELEDGRQRLALWIAQDSGAALTLRLPPADLEHLIVGVDTSGLESRKFDSRLINELADLKVPTGVPVEIELARYSTPIGRALAVRELWRLTLRSGEIVRDDVTYPAGHLPTPEFVRVLRSDGLPVEPTAPEQLVEALRGQDTTKGELMRLAVGIQDEQRAEALRALLPVVEQIARVDPERVIASAPALRWIARTSEPGADPRAWVLWLRAWARRDFEQGLPAEDKNLDLPAATEQPPAARQRRRGDENLDLP